MKGPMIVALGAALLVMMATATSHEGSGQAETCLAGKADMKTCGDIPMASSTLEATGTDESDAGNMLLHLRSQAGKAEVQDTAEDGEDDELQDDGNDFLCPKTRAGGCAQWRTLKLTEFRDMDYAADRLACQQKCRSEAGCGSFVIGNQNKKCYIYKPGCTNPTCEADPKCAASGNFYNLCDNSCFRKCKKAARKDRKADCRKGGANYPEAGISDCNAKDDKAAKKECRQNVMEACFRAFETIQALRTRCVSECSENPQKYSDVEIADK